MNDMVQRAGLLTTFGQEASEARSLEKWERLKASRRSDEGRRVRIPCPSSEG